MEARFGEMTQEHSFELGKSIARMNLSPNNTIKDFDWKPIKDYCDELFGKYSLHELLAQAYIFRMPILQATPTIMLSNQNLIHLLSSLPVEPSDKVTSESTDITRDVIAWEFFRQLLSPTVDPLDANKIILIARMKSSRKDEINRLKISVMN